MKRAFDFIAVVAGLLLIWPLILLLVLLVRIKLGSPVFFRQIRPGMHGKPFTLIKFRTMTDERDDAGSLLPDAQRITPFDKFLHSAKL